MLLAAGFFRWYTGEKSQHLFNGLRIEKCESFKEHLNQYDVIVDTGSFSNDMTSFSGADDVLTLLIHLGYLGYDFAAKEVFIPNSEISAEFMRAVKNSNWNEIVSAVVQVCFEKQ